MTVWLTGVDYGLQIVTKTLSSLHPLEVGVFTSSQYCSRLRGKNWEDVMTPRQPSQPQRSSRKPLRPVEEKRNPSRIKRDDYSALFIQAQVTRDYFSPYAPRR